MRLSLSTTVLSLALVALSPAACKNKEAAPSSEAATGNEQAASKVANAEQTQPVASKPALPVQPTPVTDAPEEYKELAGLVLGRLAAKDFDGFVAQAMVSRDELKSMMEAGWKQCPEMAPTAEQRPAAEQLLADYDPAGESVKGGFESCLAAHDFGSAVYSAASSRSHVSLCGGEMADHVELVVTLGDEQATIVLDDLVKTSDGWRLVDAGISCHAE